MADSAGSTARVRDQSTQPSDLCSPPPGSPLRPSTFRARSEADALSPFLSCSPGCDHHSRRKSTFATSKTLRIEPTNNNRTRPVEGQSPISGHPKDGLERVDGSFSSSQVQGLMTPPMTPVKPTKPQSDDVMDDEPEIMPYDFTKIDYELDRARALGQGLWSTVYLAEPIFKSPLQPIHNAFTPPSTPERKVRQLAPTCTLFAVKTSARSDSKAVFAQEARILTRLQRHRNNFTNNSNYYENFIVPFHGQDPRNLSLIFTAVIGGSLENLISRLKQMTEVSRHLELISIFPNLARNLTSGLAFIHESGVIHADIKPGNILLDVLAQPHHHHDGSAPVIRARYIDFSAAFIDGEFDSTPNFAGGGTWDFMAPEQMRSQRDLSTPTSASDVWSLGITLLSVVVGGSPWRAVCGDNLFYLREAVKGADPFGYARADPVVAKRLRACQGFVDGLRLGLQKERDRRAGAGDWAGWFERMGMEE